MAATGNEFVKLSQLKGTVDAIKTKINGVEGEIPTKVSDLTNDSNFATESFVNSSIENVAAYYITKDASGNAFQTNAQLMAATTFYSGGQVRTLTRNDYCVVLADETHPDVSGNGSTCRYIWNNEWQFQYVVNNSGLTQAQFNAVNSGITSAKVGTYDGYASSKQDKITSTNKLSYTLLKDTPTIPDVSGKLTGTKWSTQDTGNNYITFVNEENQAPEYVATFHENTSLAGYCYTSLSKLKLSKMNNDAGFITSAAIPDISGKANLSGGNTFDGNQTFNGTLYSKKVGSNPRNEYGSEFYFYNANSASTSAYNFGIYQWNDVFQFTTRTSSNNQYKSTAFEINGNTGATDYKVRPTLNGSGMALQSEVNAKQDAITASNKLAYSLISGTPTIPTDTSDLTNGAGFITEDDITGKVDKDTQTGVYRVYANKNGVQGTYDVSDNASGVYNVGTIPLRTSTGGIRVPSPSNNSDAANKSYVDNHHDDSKEDKLPTAISSGLFLQSTGTPGQYQWSTTQGGVVSITESTSDGKINVDGTDVPIHNAVTKNGYAGSQLSFSDSKTGTTEKAQIIYTESLKELGIKTAGNNGGITFYPHTTNNGSYQPGQYAVTVDRFGLRPSNGNGGSYPTVQQLGRADNKWKDLYAIDAHFSNRPTVNGVQVMIAGDVSVPTNVSAFENDAGYITSAYHDSTKQNAITSSNKLDYSLLSNTPTIPTNYVTTDTNQTISGTKTFSNDVTIASGTSEKSIILGQGKFRVNGSGSLILSGKDGASIHIRPYNATGNGVALSTGAFYPEINAGGTGHKDLGSSSSKWNNVYARYYNGETLALNGSFSALNSIGGGFAISDSVNVGMELGRRDGTAGTPYLDFHTDGSASTDYNSRIIATGNQLNVSAGGGLYVNSSKVATAGNFSLSGTTLTISI